MGARKLEQAKMTYVERMEARMQARIGRSGSISAGNRGVNGDGGFGSRFQRPGASGVWSGRGRFDSGGGGGGHDGGPGGPGGGSSRRSTHSARGGGFRSSRSARGVLEGCARGCGTATRRAKEAVAAAYDEVAYAGYRVAKPIVESENFELGVVVVIFINVISLALYKPTEPADSEWNKTLHILELSLNVLFTVEVMLRCAHVGVREYFREPWNKFDFALVLVGYSGLLTPGEPEEGDASGGMRALRALRALRPLRTITRFESLRSVVVCFIEAVPLLVSVVGLVFFFTFLFAVTGMQIFQEAYHRRCQVAATGEPETWMDEWGCDPNRASGLWDGRQCPASTDSGEPLECVELESWRGNSVAGFDNAALGMLTVFQCTTLAGWAQVMYRIMDAGAEVAVPYFVALVFFGPYFVVNLFLAVLKTKFGRAQVRFISHWSPYDRVRVVNAVP